ncbi:hypothetical protein Vadar_020706 [Vaccinium darrowii]|uniref:Uncharacterized protein n=1 Tax=Vaccinium darrowii TaxID=229202 RepID=A0ACB7Y191_9ERIC|nr:hypothetical protein Vadar_020706 [Vaccinium darrowii]
MEYVQRLLMRLFLILVIMFTVENGCNGCWEKERSALLQLKESINFPNGTSLPSWEEDDYLDCCQWERVECHPITGRVIKLSLNQTRDWVFDLQIRDQLSLDLYWQLNASVLLPFESLQSLDLSRNGLSGFVGNEGSKGESGILNELEILDLSFNSLNDSIWSFVGELLSIKTLYLSYNAGLYGAVHNLTNLGRIENLFMDGANILDEFLGSIRFMTSIQVLSLRYCAFNGTLPITGLCELKTLRELDISGAGLMSDHKTTTGFGDTLPWCLANLTSLQLLDIASNRFTGNIARSPLINLTSLEYLAISNNDFEIPISFKSFFNHSKLMFIESLNNTLLEEEDFLATFPSFQLIGLRLSNSEHGGITRSFPHFLYHQNDLKMVELSQIGFSGKFPNWLFDNNARMETLLLSGNSLGGPLLLPSHHMIKLLVLDISNNHLEGFIPYKIGSSFPSLEFLNMFTNNFEGDIPSSLGDMTALTVLDLSNNRLSGVIPVHLAMGCGRLEILKLSNNNLRGPILPSLNNLTQLWILYSDNNGFTEIPPNLSLSSLEYLNVGSNQLVGKIPALIGNMSLSFLVMSANHLEGPIPMEFCELKYLNFLDLSKNNITGGIPSCFNSSNIAIIRLSKNRLRGPFPMVFQDLPLVELDLSYNQFSGNIPTWIGNLSNIMVLLLQNNHFEGNIPKELCHLSNLTLIDLSFNNLFGSIIPCISNIEFNGIPIGENVFDYWFGYSRASSLRDLRMVLKGEENQNEITSIIRAREEVEFETKGMTLTYKGTVLYLFSGINLSHNRLSGPIPHEIGNLSHIKVLNLSHNYLTGTIPATFSNLTSIESLDLSYNHLYGKIPSELTKLSFLAVFNLSYNNLSGRMPPRVNQFGIFESNSYIGNPLLCGEPLPMKCNAAYSPPSTPRAAINGSEEDSRFSDMDVFYVSFAGSYVAVVLAIVAILFINPYWRRAWFHLVEVSLISSYYFVVDNLVCPVRGFLWK